MTTTTPKIDTTRENAERIMWLIHESKAGQEVRTKTMALIRTLLDERDLAVAREAAAWIAGRDAAVRASNAASAAAHGDMPYDRAIEVVRASITPPADTQAALDRLIAERVREAVEADRGRWQEISRQSWEAMVAMRNSINEHIPMPSIESDLMQGPENGVFCAAVAEAVIENHLAMTKAHDTTCGYLAGAIKGSARGSKDGQS